MPQFPLASSNALPATHASASERKIRRCQLQPLQLAETLSIGAHHEFYDMYTGNGESDVWGSTTAYDIKHVI